MYPGLAGSACKVMQVQRKVESSSPFLSLSAAYGRRGRAPRVIALILGLE
jgi:hypothetical protein